jgi:hypothetical protein
MVFGRSSEVPAEQGKLRRGALVLRGWHIYYFIYVQHFLTNSKHLYQ